MEPKQYYIGIDVGVTSVKEGLFDEDGNLLAKASVPTPPIVDAAGFAAVTEADRKSTRLNSSHNRASRMPSSA